MTGVQTCALPISLRSKAVVNSSFTAKASAKKFNLPADNDGICEIALDIDTRTAKAVTLTLSNAQGEKSAITYNAAGHTLSMDRTQSGIVDFSQDFPAVTAAPVHNAGPISLRIFVDRSSIEVFEKDGRAVMTNLVFPTSPYTTLSVAADGGQAKVQNLRIYPLTPASN